MKVMKHIKKIVAIGIIAVFGLGLLAGCTKTYTPDEVNKTVQTAMAQAYQQGAASIDITADNGEVIKIAVDKAVAENKDAMQAEIDRLNMVVEDMNKSAQEVQTEAAQAAEEAAAAAAREATCYTETEMNLDTGYNFDLSNRDVTNLFDGEVKFKKDKYNAEESIRFTDIKIGIDKEDFNSDVYLQVPKSGLTYEIEFDSDLPLDEISVDDTLAFKFLGENVEVSEWDGHHITFTRGNEYTLWEGQSIEVDGSKVTATMINDDSIYVTVEKDGKTESKKITEGDTKDVLDMEVYAETVLDNEALEGRNDLATLKIGTEIEVDVDDGDKYNDGKEWKWIVDDHVLGIVLNKGYTQLDKDYRPLGIGDTLCTPDEYACMEFKGLTEDNYESYSFDWSSDDNSWDAEGSFFKGIKDWDTLIIIGNKFYDEDEFQIATDTITLGDSEIELTAYADGNLSFEDVVVAHGVTTITADGDDISGRDEDYRTQYGSVLYNPENSIDDESIDVDVPKDEQLQGAIKVCGK